MLRRSPTVIRTAAFMATLAMSAALSFGLPGAKADSTLTVGDFLLQYARSVHMVLPADATPQTALAVLQAARAIPAGDVSLANPLTHGDVVRLGRSAGLKITSSTPDKSFSREEAEVFFQTFTPLLTAHAGTSTPAGTDMRTAAASAPGHANTSKGKKKGRPFQSPNEPQ